VTCDHFAHRPESGPDDALTAALPKKEDVLWLLNDVRRGSDIKGVIPSKKISVFPQNGNDHRCIVPVIILFLSSFIRTRSEPLYGAYNGETQCLCRLSPYC